MDAYIANTEPAIWRGINALKINFAGYNYRYPGFYYRELLEFREEFLRDIREVKTEIEELSINSDIAIFNGGEPLLQRAALLNLANYTKSLGLNNLLVTNLTKPFSVKRLIDNKLIDVFVVELPAPLDERFEKVTHASTFFKSWQEIVSDINKSLELLRKAKNIGIVFRTKIIPGILYKVEDLLDIARAIDTIPCSWELVSFNPERSISKVFRGVKQPSKEFIEELIIEINKHYPNLRIEWSSS